MFRYPKKELKRNVFDDFGPYKCMALCNTLQNDQLIKEEKFVTNNAYLFGHN